MNANEPRGWRRWVMFPALALLIGASAAAYLSLVPRALYRLPYVDKVGHFLLVGALAFVLVARFGDRRFAGRLRLPVALVAPAVFSVCDEALQLLSPVRSASLADLASDLAGIVCFWLLARWMFAGDRAGLASAAPARPSLPPSGAI
jgi:VanZ family protein